jgi:hypothetical protein
VETCPHCGVGASAGKVDVGAKETACAARTSTNNLVALVDDDLARRNKWWVWTSCESVGLVVHRGIAEATGSRARAISEDVSAREVFIPEETNAHCSLREGKAGETDGAAGDGWARGRPVSSRLSVAVAGLEILLEDRVIGHGSEVVEGGYARDTMAPMP